MKKEEKKEEDSPGIGGKRKSILKTGDEADVREELQ